MTKTMKKWCSHCEKLGHSDDECWCTRAVKTSPDPMPLDPLRPWTDADKARLDEVLSRYYPA